MARDATLPRRVALKSGLLVGGIFSLISFILMAALYDLSASGAIVTATTTLASLAWLLLLLTHPVVASFIAVRHTQRIRSGIGAGIIAGCIYAFISLIALACTFGLGYGTPSPGNDSSAFQRFVMLFSGWWIVTEMTLGAWLLPSAALAALGGLTANIVTRREQ